MAGSHTNCSTCTPHSSYANRNQQLSPQDGAVSLSSGDLGRLLDLDLDLEPLLEAGVWLLERDLDFDRERDLEADLDLLLVLRGVRVLERDLERE